MNQLLERQTTTTAPCPASVGYLHLGTIEGAPFGRLAGELAVRIVVDGQTLLLIDHRRDPDQLARVEIWPATGRNEGGDFLLCVACDAQPGRDQRGDPQTLSDLLQEARRSKSRALRT